MMDMFKKNKGTNQYSNNHTVGKSHINNTVEFKKIKHSYAGGHNTIGCPNTTRREILRKRDPISLCTICLICCRKE